MASYLSPFNKLIYESVRRQSESHSEISSVDSDWSDIKSIALQLGVANPDDLLTERFKIDRQKLENMIRTECPEDGTNKAEQFFESTMKITSTFISWPCRLKIGAKTKKDPHVRIVGKPDDVCLAKERILEFLDSKGIRVIMKIDISYTDHSYIIGRGGSNIKRIMEQTATHIHFPDSNRSNPVEKSNQVSLCGSLEGVEMARSLVRSSTPLIISFELPIMAPGRPVPDNDTQYVRDVEAKFNIQVIFSTRPKLHSSLVLVKGSEKEAAKVQEATQLLINFMCESIANQIHVNLQLEISPHHQDIVKGKNNSQLLSIMERTKTKIIFPDTKDVNIKPLKKSQVTITGNIDGVYRARQQLIGNLPVALIFDYPDNTYDTANLLALGNQYGVYITVRQKSRQSIMCIVLKGVEKFVDKIYEARQELLHLTTPLLKPEIPATYFAPCDLGDLEHTYRQNLAMLLANYPESPITPMPGGFNGGGGGGGGGGMLQHQHQQFHNMNHHHQQQQVHQLQHQQQSNPFNMSPIGQLLADVQSSKYGAAVVAAAAAAAQIGGHRGAGMQTPNYRMQAQQQHMQNVQQMQQQQQFKQHLQLPQQQSYQQQQLQHQQQQQHMQQHQMQQQQQNNPFMSPFLNQSQTQQHPFQPQQQQQPNMLPPYSQHNSSANTSGYHSYSSSTTSLEQLYPPYQPSSGAAAGVGSASGNSVNSAVAVAMAQAGAVTGSNGGNFVGPPPGLGPNINVVNQSTVTGGEFSPENVVGGGAANYLDVVAAGAVGSGMETQRRINGSVMAGSGRLLAKDMEMRTPTFNDMQQFYSLEQRRKIEGYKAMERAPQGEIRTPNSSWSGLGLSKTSPFLLGDSQSGIGAASTSANTTPTGLGGSVASVCGSAKLTGSGGGNTVVSSGSGNHQQQQQHQQQQSQWLRNKDCTGASPYNLNATTGLMDIVPAGQRSMLSHHKDIHSLMTHLGLEHYISTFVVNEVDIDMFASLTSENLTELGINAFGPRKKLLMAISTLNAHRVDRLPHATAKFSGSAAPGAERRQSSDW